MQKIFNVLGVLILGIVIIVLVVLAIMFVAHISFCIEQKQVFVTLNQYYKHRGLSESKCRQAHLKREKNDFASASKFYKSAYEKFHRDETILDIIHCEQKLGNTAEALMWLDLLEKRTYKSHFITLKRHEIMMQAGDEEKAVLLLDEIIAAPHQIKSTFFKSLFDNKQNKRVGKVYYKYYTEYWAKLLALDSRLNLAKSKDEWYEIGTKLFELVEDRSNDEEIIDNFLSLNWYFYIGFRAYQLHKEYLSLSNKQVIKIVSDTKWNIFNRLIIARHRDYGFKSAVEYAQKITGNDTVNTDAYYRLSKYLFRAYLRAADSQTSSDALSSKTIDSILSKSIDSNGEIPFANITIGEMFGWTTNIKASGDRIITPIVILQCNEWDWQSSSVPLAQFVGENKNVAHKLRYLNKFLIASESVVEEGLHNMTMNTIPSNRYILNLLQAEYNNQQLHKDNKSQRH